MWTRSPSIHASMRSPGPYGGTPDTNSRSRSAASDSRVMAKRAQTWSTVASGCAITHGTRASSRCRRPAALASGFPGPRRLTAAPPRRSPGPGASRPRLRRACGDGARALDQREQAGQAAAGPLAELLRLHHLDAVADRPVHEALPVDDRHAQGHATVRAGIALGLGAAELGQAGGGLARPHGR